MTKENKRFADFLTSDYCPRIMRENKLTIHINTGNIYHDDFNTNESFYDFLLVQEGTNKKILNAKFSFGENFQQYIENYLAGIRAQDYENLWYLKHMICKKFNILTNKNSKFLSYRHNDFLQMRNLEMLLVRRMRISAYYEGLVKFRIETGFIL